MADPTLTDRAALPSDPNPQAPERAARTSSAGEQMDAFGVAPGTPEDESDPPTIKRSVRALSTNDQIAAFGPDPGRAAEKPKGASEPEEESAKPKDPDTEATPIGPPAPSTGRTSATPPAAPTSPASAVARGEQHREASVDSSRQQQVTLNGAGVVAGALAGAFRRDPLPAAPARPNPAASPAGAPANSPLRERLAVKSILDTLRRRPAPAAGNPTGPAARGPQTPSSDPNAPGAAAPSGDLANKLAIFTAERMGPRREAQQMAALTLSSNGVLASLQALERQESGAILIKIRDAAKTNGGIEAVLTEMRPGGAFEDLRHEFNAALAHDEGFARAYDYAAASLATYAQARAALDASPHLRPETSLARLESLDQEIVKAAAILPGGQDGKSALEEAFKGGREALEKAAAAIRATVSRDLDVRGPAASPSFGP